MEEIRMANRINDFMPYNYGAQMKQVDRTVKQTFPTTLPRTVARGFVSNRAPSVLGTTIVSANRAKEALLITEARRLRNDAYVRNFGHSPITRSGMTGERRKKKMKLLRDILEEQVRIREAGGIDEVKKIVSRLRQGGVLSEAEVRRIEKAGYNVAEILATIDDKVKRDFPEVHASRQYQEFKEAKISGRDITYQQSLEETEGEVLAEAGVNTEIYESFIEGIRIGSRSEREALLEEFETYGDEPYRVLADRLVNEGIMEAMDIPGLTATEVKASEQIDTVLDVFRREGLTVQPALAEGLVAEESKRSPTPPPGDIPRRVVESELGSGAKSEGGGAKSEGGGAMSDVEYDGGYGTPRRRSPAMRPSRPEAEPLPFSLTPQTEVESYDILPSAKTALDADGLLSAALQDFEEEAKVQEEIRDPFQPEAAMGITMNQALEEAEAELNDIASEYITQIPSGATMSGEPAPSGRERVAEPEPEFEPPQERPEPLPGVRGARARELRPGGRSRVSEEERERIRQETFATRRAELQRSIRGIRGNIGIIERDIQRHGERGFTERLAAEQARLQEKERELQELNRQ